MSWGWRKLLQLREFVKPFFWTHVGNGLNTSLWYDRWCTISPLSRFLSPREIASEGYSIHTRVADLILNDSWNWPQRWLLKAPNIGMISVPSLTNQSDVLKCRDLDGNMLPFSAKCAWEVLRPRGVEVHWHHIVWFSLCIPRHAFHFWLVMRRSLKTQDKLRTWDVEPNVDLSQLKCLLCEFQMDSHEHLFFECPFSSKVWNYVRGLAEMDSVASSLHDILAHILPNAKSRSAKCVIGKLIVAAASYCIWMERNNRLFKGKKSPEEIRDAIMVTVQLKLMTLHFKNTSKVNRVLNLWKMPSNFRLYGS